MTKDNEPNISVNFTQPQRVIMAELFRHLKERLILDEKNKSVQLDQDELNSIQQKAREAISHAENGTKRNSLRHIIEKAEEAIERSQGIGTIPSKERLFQFKITLKHIEPPIWRRIQIRDCRLDRLHELIQLAFGWWNCHLYRFEIEGQRYGDPYPLGDNFDEFDYEDSTITKLSEIVPKNGNPLHFEYEYDFGDGWNHEILFEGCLRAECGERYPVCVEGERACPPEDVGGSRGYAEYLEAMADPKNERHDELMQWRGRFDPEEFDVEKRTKKMRRGFRKWQEE